MDTSNWRPDQGLSGAVGDSIESGDWRAQLQADSRQRIVNTIMDTLKRHPFLSGHERLQAVKIIAVMFEEEIYTTATSQSDYLQKISLKILTLEPRPQKSMPDAIQANSAANTCNVLTPAASLDSTAQTGNPNGGDWQEEVYQKITAMKDLYLLDLNDMHQKVLGKLVQYDSLPQQPKYGLLEKLKVFKNMLERLMLFLQTPKHGILAKYKDQLNTYERHIVNIINLNRRKTAPTQQQQEAFPLPHMHSMQQSQQYQLGMDTRKRNLTYSGDEVMQVSKKMAGRFEEKMYAAATSQSVLMKSEKSNSAAYGSILSYPASSDLTSQTGNLNNGDWQEEVYQKIKVMKDMCLPDLIDIHQNILGKMSQHDSLPRQLKNKQLEKLKNFKYMFECFMRFLQIPKHGILANHKEKLGIYERQIVGAINAHRRSSARTGQQQQAKLPPPDIHSMQQSQQSLSQLTQVPSDDNQMNLQGSMASMQPNNMESLQQNFNQMNLQGSVASMQQNNMEGLQQNFNQMNLQGSMASIQNQLHIEK